MTALRHSPGVETPPAPVDSPHSGVGAVTAGPTGGGEPPEPDPAELSALVRRCRDGDTAAFAGVVEQCTQRLFNFLLRMTGQVQDAEDLVQDTFLKAFRSLPRFDPSRSFLPWLFTIARRVALNHRRRRPSWEECPAHRAFEVPDEGSGGPGTEAGDRTYLWRLARRLKPRQYEVLWLHYGEGFSVAEIAAVLGTNTLHVKVLLHRARRALLPLARRAGFGR